MLSQKGELSMAQKKITRKVIITAACTGAAHTPTMSEYLPLTPKQIANDAVRAYEAGAAIAHIHARNPKTGQPTADLNVFQEILADIKSRCNVIVCITTGGAGTIEERIAVVPRFKPELATLNTGSLSRTMIHVWDKMKDRPLRFEWEKTALQREEVIFTNTYRMMREYSHIMREHGTRAELEIWDSGQISNVEFMLQRGYIERPIHIQFVMGGVSAVPTNINALLFLYEQSKRVLGEFTWSVAPTGRDTFSMAAVILAMGGNVRVGLEDSLYVGYGRLAKSSAEQVERVVRLARDLEIEPATPDEARQIIGLKGIKKVNY
jgi:uncharacterized protein (DUF849 family)